MEADRAAQSLGANSPYQTARVGTCASGDSPPFVRVNGPSDESSGKGRYAFKSPEHKSVLQLKLELAEEDEHSQQSQPSHVRTD